MSILALAFPISWVFDGQVVMGLLQVRLRSTCVDLARCRGDKVGFEGKARPAGTGRRPAH